MTITINLSLPPRECSSNGGGHPIGKARAIKAYREQAAWLMRGAARSMGKPVPVRISARFYTHKSLLTQEFYRPKDIQNAISSLKAAVDGFVDAGLVPRDTAEWVKWGQVDIISNSADPRSNGKPRVEITVERVAAE